MKADQKKSPYSVLKQVLDKKGARVYLAALELGTASVAAIAKKVDIPRSTCYLVLDEIKKLGLISEIKANGKTRFSAEHPSVILKLIQDRGKKISDQKQLLEQSLPELHALYNQNPHKPSVRFYEDLPGIKIVLENALEADEILVLCSGYYEPIEAKLADYLDEYFERLDQQGIITHELLGPAPDLEPYIRKYRASRHLIKKFPRETNHFQDTNTEQHNQAHIDKLIYNNTLAIISFEHLNATVITHKPIVDFERSLFRNLWATTDPRGR